jgi:hypothetical protein
MPRVKSSIIRTLSRISRRGWVGSLKDKDSFPLGAGPHGILQRSAVRQIDWHLQNIDNA